MGRTFALRAAFSLMLAGAAGSPAFATQLVPRRNTAAPGDSVRVAIVPPLAATIPSRARLFLSAAGRGGPRTELRIRDWNGESLVAVLPCNARYEDSGGTLLLAREIDDGRGNTILGVLATSEDPRVRTPRFQVRAGNGDSCAVRVQPDPRAAPVTREASNERLQSRGPASSRTRTAR
jgi:hypothetical protein